MRLGLLKGDVAPRIASRDVPPLIPVDGAIRALIMGEAPGPRGADQSGVPFLGDRAGRLVYRALRGAECVTWPDFETTLSWDGQQFLAAAVHPAIHGVMLTNAFPRCPTSDGHRFRAPTRAELESSLNRRRLATELELAASRGCRVAIGLGKVAAGVLDQAGRPVMAGTEFIALPHPSAQGLLQAAPQRGKGLSLSSLEEAWIDRLVAILDRARSTPSP